MASSVENLTAFALQFLSMERFASDIPTCSDSSVSPTLRLAIITSRFTIIGIFLFSVSPAVIFLVCLPPGGL